MKEKTKPSRELIERIYGAVRGIGEQSKRTREVIAEVLGLHKTDLRGADFLYSRDGACTAGELAQATGLTSGSATALIDRLEKAGYARRATDPQDRRRQIVRMRNKAIGRCEAVYKPIQKDLFKLWSGYSAEQLKLIEDFITRSIKLHAESLERLRPDSPK
jgi:DNA-binding MarR family transcriptional regulator